ncbi:probable DNA mismatch repair protein Msh6 [Drosophila eugracilis]|uniref:probable DNA mismatch repair protein Msh6 n=1 Tax=Drosophila eugracilis TaxID=29029 RepID=UPI0007E65C59|nr:probable DNA mismatch repair protein Msh6 [Drosophila eugracilis]
MMSKKLNTSAGGTPTNTLFKYFSKSPAVDKKKLTPSVNKDLESAEKESPRMKQPKLDDSKNSKSKEPSAKKKLSTSPTAKTSPDSKGKDKLKKKDTKLENPKNSKPKDSTPVAKRKLPVSDDEAPNGQRKRKRIVQPESESESEMDETKSEEDFSDCASDYEPDGNEVSDDSASSGDEEVSPSENDMSIDSPSPKKSRKKSKILNNNNNEPLSKKVKLETSTQLAEGSTFQEKLKNLQSNAKKDASYDDIVTTTSTLDEPVVWPHQKLDFLQPDKIKDKAGRRPDHPAYDKSTLHVPEKFLNGLSPGVRQWWVLKSDNFDCVLFFKVGKFYELYHMDADVGVTELGFTYMRGEFAHSGFPEISFDKMSTILVDRGFKIARVEQTETPDMMTERCKRIKSTKFDKVVAREICQITNRGTQVFGSQCKIGPNHKPNYMLALVEKDEGTWSRFGVCFIDTSIGDFHMGEFEDDKNCSRLLTLLSHHMPVLLLNEKSALSQRSQQIVRTVLGGILKELVPSNGSQACSAEKTLKLLAERYYAGNGSDDNWPLVLRTMQSDLDHLGLTPNDNYKLALKALGECIFFIHKCKLEPKVMPMARYQLYVPPDQVPDAKPAAASALRRSHMVLDATTLSNLRIIGEEHTLLSTLDHCCTKFGKRLLHHWLCAPSCDVEVIKERQDAIGELIRMSAELQEVRALLAPMPDFERNLAQIHLFGNKQKDHPDSRAILFEEKIYNRQKLLGFMSVLKGFNALTKLPTMFHQCETALLKRLTQLPESGGSFPDLSKELNYFATAFDHEAAAKTGVIAPQAGMDAEYDSAMDAISEIEGRLKVYLVEQERHFGCRLSYFGSDKKRYQLDVPESHASKANKSYTLEGQTKGKKPCRRYTTAESRALLKDMQHAEDTRNMVLKDLARRLFERFSNHYEQWKQCIDCVAKLDVLCSLAEYAGQQMVICVPELVSGVEQPFIQLEEGYHPCANASTYIPNGLELGTKSEAPLSLLTGPNMGGKSTLMRELGLLVIMAQIGAHIPAASCRLSLVDRIFTRLGAQDDILAGHSTFLVELNETSLILKHATCHSLVLLDELGRGTATYDGTAIAASVVNFLANLKCRTLFSTHYHNLIDFFHDDKRITLGHMACMVENEDNEDPTQETVTFLYKYTAGACPKSYGFNAAKLAGMPQGIIKRAYELSKKVEAIALQRKITAKIVAATAGSEDSKKEKLNTLKDLLKQLKMCQV